MEEMFDAVRELLILTEDREYPNGLTIFVGGDVKAPAGFTVLMTVDGIVTPIAPGDYPGVVKFQVKEALDTVGKCRIPDLYTPGQDEKDVRYHHPYRPGLLVDTDADGKTSVVAEKSLDSVFQGSVYNDEKISGGSVTIRDNRFNSILVQDGVYRIENMTFDSDSCGGDDFELFGATIAAAGNSKVVVDNVSINNRGVISTAATAGEFGDLLIENSTIRSAGTDNQYWWPDSMTEAPWVLGIDGTVRTLNVVDCSTVTVYNSDVASNGWGVLSSDDTSEGATYYVVNSRAHIDPGTGFDSGYGLYSLRTCRTHIFGTQIDVPTYGVVICRAGADTVIGASSKENLDQYLGPQTQLAAETDGFASVEERNTVIRSGRFGILWHNVNDRTLHVLPGTKFETGKAVFLIKADEAHMPGGRIAPPGHPTIEADGAELFSEEGTIVLLMESDDAGMGVDGHDKHWASYYVVPDGASAKPVEGYDLAAEDDVTMHVNFRNMTLAGNLYNTRFATPQNMAVKLDNVQIAGVISSGIQQHVNFKPGQKILTHQSAELGNVSVTPAPAVVNGVMVSLTGGSTWTVTDTSYLTALTVEAGSSIAAPEGKTLSVTVNGEAVSELTGSLIGSIIISVN